jgi:ubiquinone/menaquinone biosynthesis C-methylase UbiE
MKSLSKICDAADWFDPEFNSVVINELKEGPRFHRKQWEFAMIFLALKKLGFLNEKMNGLSLGGGNERVLYAIAKHVKKLTVTDLYENSTSWDCARTNDPDEFIRSSKPFDVDDSKIKALRMDMRNLDFEDNTFDFCYSSCAIEHIGKYEDFVQHLNEVYRCLKDNGLYVFTTELQLGNVTIEDPNNHIFSPQYLNKIFRDMFLTPEFDTDISLTPHEINKPYPSNVKNLCYNNESNIINRLMNNYPHTILLRGRYPFTSVQFIFRKRIPSEGKSAVNFNRLSETVKYLDDNANDYKKLIESSITSLAPFSSLPNGISHYYLDHSEFISSINNNKDDYTLFHTDYFWLGSGERVFEMKLDLDDVNPGIVNAVQIKIHGYPTLNSKDIECIFEKDYKISEGGIFKEHITIKTNIDYCYAVLGKMISGNCIIKNISLESWSLKNQKSNDLNNHKLHQLNNVT